MLRHEHRKGDWGIFIAVVLIIGMAAIWALIPVRVMEETWRLEQAQMMSLVGETSSDWIRAQMAGTMAVIVKDAEAATNALGDSQIERWLKGRIYTSLLWVSLATYRASTLLMWTLMSIPMIIAASIDGFYIREIRKTTFISQSPIRHKIGVNIFKLVSTAIVAWLIMPIPMPVVVAPIVICLLALSMWLWVGHLQKRL